MIDFRLYTKCNKMKNILINRNLAILSLLLVLFSSCKKYADPAAIFEEYERGSETKSARKVLLIAIDGAVGTEVQKIMPTNMAEMIKTSKYTWNGLSDVESNDASTWTSMVTGVSSKNHKILDNSFRPKANPSDPHATATFTPTFLYRIMENRPEYSTVAISPSNEIVNRLLIEAGTKIVAANDQVVRDSAVYQLEKTNPNVVIAHFDEVNKAGVQSGFSADNPVYKAAVDKVDGYIGDLLKAIKQRPDYDKEEWLVVVTSNHGGVNQSYGGPSLKERTTFSIFYNPSFKSLELKSDLVNSVRFFGYDGVGSNPSGVRAQAVDAAGDYNPNTGAITIEAKIKFNKNANGEYKYFVPPFLSKTANRSGSTIGWCFLRNDKDIELYVANGSAKIDLKAVDVGNDGLWHTITGVIAFTGTQYIVKFYVDGTLSAEGSLAGTVPIISPAPLVLGYWPTVFTDQFVDMSMANVRIWKKELSPAVIKSNVCEADVLATHPDYASLVGYWPADDGDNTFRNKVTGKPNFTLSGAFNYSVTNMNSVCEAKASDILVGNVDITSQVFYWLKIDPPVVWGLEGTVFLRRFEVEFVK